MAFAQYEDSNYAGAPISLYMFSRGTQRWLYTNADSAYTITVPILFNPPDVQVYEPLPISDSGITQSGEPAQDTTVITLPWVNPVVELFIGTPPSESVAVRIFRTQANDPDKLALLAWIGTISSVKRTDPGTAAAACNTLAQSFQRNGLRLGWQRTCPFALYDPKTCKVNKADFAVNGTIVGMDGITIIVAEAAGLPDGSYRGGFIEWLVADSTYDRRAIEVHVGTGLSLLGITDGLTLGMVVTMYRGCDRLIQTCNDVFHNVDNNGSVPTMPGKSPFDGNPVF